MSVSVGITYSRTRLHFYLHVKFPVQVCLRAFTNDAMSFFRGIRTACSFCFDPLLEAAGDLVGRVFGSFDASDLVP